MADPQWESLKSQGAREHNMVYLNQAVVGDTTYLPPGHSYFDLHSRSMKVVRQGISKKSTLCLYEGVEYWVSCDYCPMRGMYIPCEGCGRCG